MNENGFVQLPIDQYNLLRDSYNELQKIKDGNFGVEVYEDYDKKPRIRVTVKNENMQAAFDKVKEQFPDFEFSYAGDASEDVYGAIKALKAPEAPEL
jgi:hypothetical protein